MNVPLPIKRNAHLALALSMFLILEAPLGGERLRSIRMHSDLIEASDATDEGLLFPDTGANDQAAVGFAPDGWMRFETNGCGQLQRIENGATMMTNGAFRSTADADDEDELDPSDEARVLFGRWLSAHAGIAVVSDAIARSCGGSFPDDQNVDDEKLAPDIDARRLDQRSKRDSLQDHRMTIV